MKIGDLCTYAPKSSIKAGDAIIDGRYMFFTSSSDENKRYSDYQLDCEGIIMGTGGNATLHYYNGKFATSTDCVVLLSNETIRCKYLYYFFLSNMDILESGFKGVGLKHTNKNYINSINISSVPSFEMQDRVIKVLDKVQSIIDKRKKQLSKLDELVKSRFVELFGNPISNPMKWDIYQLEECLERIDNGKSLICSDKPRNGDNPAILKLSAATYGDYRPNENKALLDESLFVESSEVHAGDLLFTRKNTPELVGTAAYVQNTPPKLMMPDLIFRLVPNEKVNAVFLWQLINCKEFRPVIQAISGGSAKSMSNISKERLGKIKVICPPRELQDSLIPFVKRVDKSKFEIKQSLEKLELLKKALMQKYFG